LIEIKGKITIKSKFLDQLGVKLKSEEQISKHQSSDIFGEHRYISIVQNIVVPANMFEVLDKTCIIHIKTSIKQCHKDVKDLK
jgi:hypothetical protein